MSGLTHKRSGLLASHRPSHPTGAQIVHFDDDATLVTVLVSRQPEIMATANGSPFEAKIVIKTNPHAIGVREGDTALKAAPDEWNGVNLANGKLKEIYMRYNGVGLPERMPA